MRPGGLFILGAFVELLFSKNIIKGVPTDAMEECMNKKLISCLAGLVLIMASVYITASYQLRTDKPAEVAVASIAAAPPATDESIPEHLSFDTAETSEDEARVMASPIAEAVQKDAEEPVVKKAAPAPSNASIQEQPNTAPAAQPAATVSRAVPANNAKYPLVSKVNGSYGQFHYRNTAGGRIEIDPQWIQANIVTITLPGLNRSVQVHRNAADNFIKAFTLIKNGTAVVNGRTVPLLSLVKTMDGTWVPRHVNWNPSRGLSNHSWGTAIDINAANHFRYVNPSTERNDPNLILWEKAFKPAGFSWGNSYADAMHYELLD